MHDIDLQLLDVHGLIDAGDWMDSLTSVPGATADDVKDLVLANVALSGEELSFWANSAAPGFVAGSLVGAGARTIDSYSRAFLESVASGALAAGIVVVLKALQDSNDKVGG